MDSSEFTIKKSPRRELQLQGPRPTPLKIHKESHKIRKPPLAPPPQQPSQPHHHHHHHHYQQPRQPVIIYTVSPKIIHTNPCDFMSLVQRLTGLSSSSSSSSNTTNPLTHNTNNGAGAISLAERFATIEKAARSPQGKIKLMNKSSSDGDHMMIFEGGFDVMNRNNNMMMESNKCLFPGILSPGPNSLQPVPQNFFSPPSDSFFHDLSPVLYGNRNFMEGSFMPTTPNYSYFVSPHLANSPNPSIDLFNNFPDL